VGAHAWGLYAKIRDIDSILSDNPDLQNTVREVHPELSFMGWNEGEAITEGKKTFEGMAVRLSLVKSHFGKEAYRTIREAHLPKILADDDINDAFAALWTAERIHNGTAVVIPDPPETDSLGLRMEMWY
jgi:predicted RNase H-like nuclease